MGRRIAIPTWTDNIEEGTASMALLFPSEPSLDLVRRGKHATDTPEAAAERRAFVEAYMGQVAS